MKKKSHVLEKKRKEKKANYKGDRVRMKIKRFVERVLYFYIEKF